MKSILILTAIVTTSMMLTTGCASHCCGNGSCNKPAATAHCDGSCCKDGAACTKCCGDATGCAKCCKKS